MFCYLESIIDTMNLAGVEHVHLIFYAKASPVGKYLVDSIDGRNHTSGIHTRFPDNPMIHRPSTIDYTLAKTSLFSKVSWWRDLTQSTDADHIGIITEINSEVIHLARPASDWEKIKWQIGKGKPNPVIEEWLKDYCSEEWGYVPIADGERAEEGFRTSLKRLIDLVRS